MTRKRTTPPATDDRDETTKATHCLCGAELLGSGRCAESGEWPRITWARVFKPALAAFEKVYFEIPAQPNVVCPFCRGALSWDGGCRGCYGSATPSDHATWTFPGKRFDRVGAHWVEIDGPRRACSPSENAAALELLDRVRRGAPIVGAFEELARILRGHGALPEGPDPRLMPQEDRDRHADDF